jgi:hypothetical protein
MELYRRHLAPDGIVAFHVTNRFLRLAPVVERIAASLGLHTALIHDDAPGDNALRRTDWVLVASNPRILEQAQIHEATTPIEPIAGLGVWTDDFNNLFQVLK